MPDSRRVHIWICWHPPVEPGRNCLMKSRWSLLDPADIVHTHMPDGTRLLASTLVFWVRREAHQICSSPKTTGSSDGNGTIKLLLGPGLRGQRCTSLLRTPDCRSALQPKRRFSRKVVLQRVFEAQGNTCGLPMVLSGCSADHMRQPARRLPRASYQDGS